MTLLKTIFINLQYLLSNVSAFEELCVCGDFNGHVGSKASGFEGVHGELAFGKRNLESERILEFAVTYNFVIGNSWFTKKFSHLITYQSGVSATQINFFLYRRRFMKHVKNVKMISGEKCVFSTSLWLEVFRFLLSSETLKGLNLVPSYGSCVNLINKLNFHLLFLR